MKRLPLANVHILTLREIAEMWAPNAGVPITLMLRELRLAAVNIPRRDKGLDHIPPDTPDDQLPDPDEKVDRDWLIEFCGKQGWEHPTFWFGKVPSGPSFPGRRSVMRAILQELQDRAARGELSETLAEQSRQLSEWAERTFPGELTPKAKSVENGVRPTYNALRRASPPAGH